MGERWKKCENVGQQVYIFSYVGRINSRELINNMVSIKPHLGDTAVWFLNTTIKSLFQ